MRLPCLYEWFSYLEEAALNWNEISSDDLYSYSIALHHYISPHTKKPLKSGTIRDRLRLILKFYDWAFTQGLISEQLTKKRERLSCRPLDDNFLAHVSPSSKNSKFLELLPKVKSEPGDNINALSKRELKLVLHELGALPPIEGQEGDSIQPTRCRLAAELSLNTGMRLDEVISLQKWQILELRPSYQELMKPCSLYITKTKGLRPRTVFVPSWLVIALHWYVDNERQNLIDVAKTKGKFRKQNSEPKQLFLNGITQNITFLAEPISRDTLMLKMREAVLRAGLTRKEIHLCPDTREETLQDVGKCSFHDFRHTYAVNLYFAKKKFGDSEPWKTVQTALGHKSLKTTIDTYLRSVQIDEAEISDSLVHLFEQFSASTR